MSKTFEELWPYIPERAREQIERTEPGFLAHLLGEMVYARSHDKAMHSMYPEKIYVGNLLSKDEYMKKKLGVENDYIKSDMIVRKVIDLLNAYSLKEGLR